MKISDIINEATIKQELPRNAKTVKSPALLTFDQWMDKINPGNKWHSSDSYDWDLEKMNQSKSTNHGKLYVSKKLRGVTIDFYGNAYKLNYAKRNGDDSWVTDDNGNLIYYSDEEIAHLGKDAVGYTFTAVDHETKNIVGTAQDEWGALLIVVAKEYRGFGIGEILGQLMREYVPNYNTGGVTNAGKKNLKNVHNKIVSKAAANGQYSKWVKDGTLTIQHAKQILSDANVKGNASELSTIEQPAAFKPNTESELLWAWVNGSIIVYNKQLLTSIPDNFSELGNLDEYWRERALDQYLVGMIYIGSGAVSDELNIWQFGGATEQLKHDLMSVGLGIVEVQIPDAYVKVLNVITGYIDEQKVIHGTPTQRGEVLIKPRGYAELVPRYIELFRHEAQTRKPLDKYGEIIALIAEEATAKFDDYHKIN